MGAVHTPSRDLDPAVTTAAGALNLVHAEITRIAAEALTTDSWTGTSPTYWLVHTMGTTASRATMILAVAERRHLFPTVIGRFDAGELSLEQVYELVQAPPCADADIEHWGTIATPARIRRSIKRRYPPQPADPNDAAGDAREQDMPTPIGGMADHDRLTTGVTDDHRWRLTGEFDLETGQLIEHALLRAREDLWERGQRTISQADCLREIIERFHDGIDSPLRRDRAKVWLHLDAASADALTPAGVRIPDSVRDKICCDGIIQPVWERDGVPFNLGRARHIVPERTRRIVMLRDQGCRVPGCSHDRIIDIHHITTGSTAAPPTPGTSWPCARGTIACTTRASSASPATPTNPMAWCSPTSTAEDSSPPGPPLLRPRSPDRPTATSRRSAAGSTGTTSASPGPTHPSPDPPLTPADRLECSRPTGDWPMREVSAQSSAHKGHAPPEIGGVGGAT
jgi:hypothetical protein